MHKILLHCESHDESKALREVFEEHLPFPIYYSFDQRTIERTLSRNLIHLTIFECNKFGLPEYNLITDLRSDGHFHPIIVVPTHVPDLTGSELLGVQEKLRLHFMPKPIHERTLVGISKKLLITNKVPQQRFPRFVTDQVAIVESSSIDGSVKSNMYNLSLGGAYVEYDANVKLSVGDHVRMRILLGDLNRDREVSGRIVWNTRKGHYSGRQGVGVKFT